MKIVLMLLHFFTFSALAGELPHLLPGEQFKFSGKVESIIGHSFGYVPPAKGALFELDLNDLPGKELHFDKPDGSGSTYIPISSQFEFYAVKRYNDNAKTPSGIRLISHQKTHKVTIDIINNGKGDSNPSKLWILIETQGHMLGVWYLIGNVEYKLAEKANTN